ncbi:MAG: VOC family protein [Bacteroidota bacterium]
MLRIQHLLVLFTVLPYFGMAQKTNLPKTNAFFSAIIVSDIDASRVWYCDNLGFKSMERAQAKIPGLYQDNLQNGKMAIELIQIRGSIPQSDALEGKPPKTKLEGFFKFGMKVRKLDKWVEKLKANGVNIYGDIVNDRVTKMRTVIILDPDGNRIQLFGK